MICKSSSGNKGGCIQMTRSPTSILLDNQLKVDAKKVGLNISRFVEDSLRDFLSKKELYDSAVPVLLDDEVKAYSEIAKNREDWEKFSISRCSLIKTKTGIYITPHKLIHLVNQKLKEEKDLDVDA